MLTEMPCLPIFTHNLRFDRCLRWQEPSAPSKTPSMPFSSSGNVKQNTLKGILFSAAKAPNLSRSVPRLLYFSH